MKRMLAIFMAAAMMTSALPATAITAITATKTIIKTKKKQRT